jgi:hypothetical protein
METLAVLRPKRDANPAYSKRGQPPDNLEGELLLPDCFTGQLALSRAMPPGNLSCAAFAICVLRGAAILLI